MIFLGKQKLLKIWSYVSDDLKTDFFKCIFFKYQKICCQFFLRVGGPTRAAPLDIACFWIEDPNRNRLALNGISAINLTRFKIKKCLWFFSIFFSLKFFFVLKSSETYAKKNLIIGFLLGGGRQNFGKIFGTSQRSYHSCRGTFPAFRILHMFDRLAMLNHRPFHHISLLQGRLTHFTFEIVFSGRIF